MHNNHSFMDRRRFLQWTALTPFALSASGALLTRPAEAAPAWKGALDFGAGRWQPWLIPSASALLPPPPPGRGRSKKEALATLLPLQAQRSQGVEEVVNFWDAQAGVPAWGTILLEKIRTTNVNPVLAARAMALFHTALADATIAVWYAKFRHRRAAPTRVLARLDSISSVPEILPSYPSEHAAVGAAAAEVLKYLFPNSQSLQIHGQTLTFDEMAAEAAQSRLNAGANYPSDLPPGADIGLTCGQAAVQRGQNDGSATPWAGTVPVGPQYWIPTPPGFVQNPLLPLAGTWQTWVLSSGAEFRAPDPNVYAGGQFTPAFLAQVQEVADLRANLTDPQKQIANFWADGGGTVTPPGHWLQFAIQHALLAELSAPRAARALALTSVGAADSATCCWDTKFAHWLLRPISAIRNIPGQPFSNPAFTSFIGTPPFPAYTSGHSTFSGCAATVLNYLFRGGLVPDAFGVNTPFQQAAEQAAVSRLYGGIHYRIDSEDGLHAGRLIAGKVIERARNDGAVGP